jgi:prepilin-type N-terminal cleavage/methylation domain-containing protein
MRGLRTKRRSRERGFTLIELVVVLAIIGILIALAVPRYIGGRKYALISEADNTLQEMKTMAWAYYQQYYDWSSIGGVGQLGVVVPANSCWTFGVPSAGSSTITLQAIANVGGRSQCSVLSGAEQVNLSLDSFGRASRTATGL